MSSQNDTILRTGVFSLEVPDLEPFLSLQPRHIALQAWGLAESSLLLLLGASFLLISSSCLSEPSFPSSWFTPLLYMKPTPYTCFLGS